MGSRALLRWGLATILTTAAFFGPAANAVQPGLLDQNQEMSEFGYTGGLFWQTFTAGITGSITGLELEVVHSPLPSPLNIQIQTVANGVPTGVIVAAGTIAGSSADGAVTWAPVSLNAPAPVVAGTRYAIVVDDTAGWWVWEGSPSGCYAGGVSSKDPTFDFAFRTYVTPTVGLGPMVDPSRLTFSPQETIAQLGGFVVNTVGGLVIDPLPHPDVQLAFLC